jgi:hypothetical protein
VLGPEEKGEFVLPSTAAKFTEYIFSFASGGVRRREFPMSLSTNASAIDGVVFTGEFFAEFSREGTIRQSYLSFRTVASDALLDVTHSQRSFL